MYQDDFADGLDEGPLRLHENLRVFRSADKAVLERVGRVVVIARPEIAEDRENVRVSEKRIEGPHAARASIFAEAPRAAQTSALKVAQTSVCGERRHCGRISADLV